MPTLTSPKLARTASRHRWLAAAALLAALVMLWHGPIAQWPGYHAFADDRAWFGLPNATNVLSNLPFAVILETAVECR